MSARFSPNGGAQASAQRPWLRIVLCILAILVVLMLVVGVLLAFSARSVMGKLGTMRTQAGQFEQSLLEGDADQLRANAASLSATIDDIHGDVQSPIWVAGSFLPFVGQDVSNARTLVDCAYDLSHNALNPFVEGVAGLRMHDLVVEHAVDTGMLASMRDTVVTISPSLVASAQKISALRPGVVAPMNEAIENAREPLKAAGDLLSDSNRLFDFLLAVLGDGGQTRTYVLLAQTNAEIRAGGGFPGSVGTVQVTDGYATINDFHTVYEVKELTASHGFAAPITPEEITIFSESLGTDAAGVTLTPNYQRSGEIAKQAWENAYGSPVDGVIAMDPVFVQRILALVGGITTYDGTVVDGQNAAQELMNGVYMRYGDAEGAGNQEDMFFVDVAHQSFSKLLDAMGGFQLDMFSKLWTTLKQSGTDRRFQVWMADPSHEALMQELGIAGNFSTDVANPQLGVYANDNTWSKICWYLDISADLDNGTRNPDGTTTYNVTAHFKNNMTPEEAASAPIYVRGDNPLKRDVGDMVETAILMAPTGASIGNYEVHQDSPVPAGTEPTTHAAPYGRDSYASHINILPGGDTTVTFTLTMPAGVDKKPEVVTSPLCHD